MKFDHDLEISFNSRYLIDVASQLDGEKVEIFFNDTGSPALIKDPGDFDRRLVGKTSFPIFVQHGLDGAML